MSRYYIGPILIAANLLLLAFITSGCFTQKSTHRQVYNSRSQTPTLTNDTSSYTKLVQPPDGMETVQSNVFLEKVEKVHHPDTAYILIRGNFSNGCTRLSNVSHSLDNNTLLLDFEAWQPKNEMCTQVLSPFTFAYTGLSRQEIDSLNFYLHEGKKIPL